MKLHISNLCFKLDFRSDFSINKELIDYTELRNVVSTYSNISLTLVAKLNIWDDTKGLRVIIDQLIVNGKGSDLNFYPRQSGLFINEVERFFDDSRDFIMANLIIWLEDFRDPI